MQEVKKIIDEFSIEKLAPVVLREKNEEKRDELKGQLLAYNDFNSIYKVYEGKDNALGKLKDYMERFDPYAENLNLFINLYEKKAETVIASKIETLFVIKNKILEYLKDIPVETNDNKGTTDGEDTPKEAKEPESVESEVPEKPKR